MKHILTISLCLFAFTFARAASVNWVTVETAAATGDTTPGLASAANYAAYCLTATAAEELFASSALAAVTDYLKTHYETGRSGVVSSGTALTADSYGLGQYSFTEYSASAVAGQDYLAILFYDKADRHEFRVFGKESIAVYDTSVVFDDQSAPADTFGAWTTPGAVPEPTSALLLLIGVAGLALKRKRTCSYVAD